MIITNLVPIECANCHMVFGVTEAFQKARRNDHKGFTCPAGHSNVYNQQSEEEKLRLERDRLKQQLACKDDENQRQRDRAKHAIQSARTYKGHLTRTKKRISHGVCPCCSRTFANLQRHMATQHKDYAEKAS